MQKDKRYNTVKNLIAGGFIKSFGEIFDTLPKSVLYTDMGINNARFNTILKNVEVLSLYDIFRMATLFDIDEKVMIDLVYNYYTSNKKIKKKK